MTEEEKDESEGRGWQASRRTAKTLKRLRDLGVRIAVDDFGTGYASFQYLLHFSVDLLKIDRSFIAGMVERPTYAAVVRAVIRLAHELGQLVVAEGVESADQRDQLEWLGCDLAQGYLWSPSLSGDDFRRWLASRPQSRGGQAGAPSVSPDPRGTGSATDGSDLD